MVVVKATSFFTISSEVTFSLCCLDSRGRRTIVVKLFHFQPKDFDLEPSEVDRVTKTLNFEDRSRSNLDGVTGKEAEDKREGTDIDLEEDLEKNETAEEQVQAEGN